MAVEIWGDMLAFVWISRIPPYPFKGIDLEYFGGRESSWKVFVSLHLFAYSAF